VVFNPLPGLELVWDIVAFIISFILILMLVQINAAIDLRIAATLPLIK